MECESIIFSGHALRRIFERGLSHDAVIAVVRKGEEIAEYPEDHPYPSCLLLGYVDNQPIHVVVARDPVNNTCFVVTAYCPDPAIWTADFRGRRQS